MVQLNPGTLFLLLFFAALFGGLVLAAIAIPAAALRPRPHPPAPTRRPWRGHGRLHFGAPTKREDKPVKIEVDEQVDVNLPDIVDDDGDAVDVDQVVWSTSDEAVAVFEPVGDGKSQAILKARGVVGQVRVTATVYAADGGNGAYTGDVAIGLGVPVGGQLGFGTPTKITPSE